jgi:hypothetical protein
MLERPRRAASPGDEDAAGLRVLQHEKAHVAEEIAMGVKEIYPAGVVIGLLTGTEETKLQVATGEYNRLIEKKIAEIKATCGL